MKKTPKVILFIETTHSYGRGLLRGVARYAKQYGPWFFYRDTPFYGKNNRAIRQFALLKRYNIDGMIVREPRGIEDYRNLGIPLIISPNLLDPVIPTIVTNTDRITELAAEHLLQRGFNHFAFCGFEKMDWSELRLAGFVKYIRQAGFAVDTFVCPVEKIVHPTEKEQSHLIRWLSDLPKPVGLMACNDDMGRTVLENCKLAGIHVPEQIAVVGVDNDELTCELTDPLLSSVALASEKAGYQAAELLDRLMQGEPMSGQIIHHYPTHVVTRPSTDILAVADGDVANALQFIRDHVREPIQVDDVTEHIAITRQGLNKKFRKCLNRTVHQEIIRCRIQQIIRMLMETNLSISDIARSVGYTELKYVSRLFHQETGLSPSQYRRKYGVKL